MNSQRYEEISVLGWKGVTSVTARRRGHHQLAAALARLMAQLVLDSTGVDGIFNITLDAAPDSLPGLNARTKDTDSLYPSVFSALKQLGLALEPRNVTVNILVVDSADRIPVPN